MIQPEAFKRFTGKAEAYDRYRPSYPEAYLTYLRDEAALAGKTIAEVGCGTGILTRSVSPFAHQVIGIEPNDDMRALCEQATQAYSNICICKGYAEETGLASTSVDAVMAGQAFHWFDVAAFKKESQRILKPGGKVALVWNSLTRDHPLTEGISQLCKTLDLGFAGFNEQVLDREKIERDFFHEFNYHTFENPMCLTKEAFIGRYLSTSYAPAQDDERFPPYLAEVTALFDRYAENLKIVIPYKTISWVGRL